MPYVAILTPAGRGAVATVAIRGPQALAIVRKRFAAASATPLSRAQGRILFGRFRGAGGSEEEIVAVVIAENEIELHCHGGPAAADAIVQTLVASGAQHVSWQQWAGSSGEDSLHEECRAALAQAKTERSCAILLDQYRGALDRELARIDSLLSSGGEAPRRDAAQRLARLAALSHEVGAHLTNPWRIVIAGAPNVGKSSLINALLGYQRSIVCDQPGTTRDALAAFTAIDGWPVELIDTAGEHAAADLLEAAGIQRAHAALRAADAVLHVVDAAQAPRSPAHPGAILVGNKSDLLSPPERDAWRQRGTGPLVSAKTGAGLAELCSAISRQLAPAVPDPGEAVPFTARQRLLVQARLESLGEPLADR